MTEFVNFITKNIEFDKDDDRRIFTGHITAEVVDHQNDFIFVKEVMKVMETFMKVLPVLSEVHTNRMIGKVLNYEKSEIQGHASVKITAQIFKQDGVELYDQVWKKITKGEYAGLSMGGGSKKREPMRKDGRYVMNLADLELYEIAVCPSPANPLAIIDKFNKFAKSDILSEKMFKLDNRNIVQCSSISCEFNKTDTETDGTNEDKDKDIDNRQTYKNPELKKDHEGSDGEITEDTRRKPDIDNKEKLEQFDKPENHNNPELKKDHIPGTPEKIEEEARKKNKEMEKNREIIMDYIKQLNENIFEKDERIVELQKKIESLKSL